MLFDIWRGGREAEGNGLLNRRMGNNPYRGFESRPLRSSLRYERHSRLRCATNGTAVFAALRKAQPSSLRYERHSRFSSMMRTRAVQSTAMRTRHPGAVSGVWCPALWTLKTLPSSPPHGEAGPATTTGTPIATSRNPPATA